MLSSIIRFSSVAMQSTLSLNQRLKLVRDIGGASRGNLQNRRLLRPLDLAPEHGLSAQAIGCGTGGHRMRVSDLGQSNRSGMEAGGAVRDGGRRGTRGARDSTTRCSTAGRPSR
ncbi:hypothetical protein GCM10027290_07950 [Micromonospora sonneratiae]